MKYCTSCKVNIIGNKIKCPLCKNTLPSSTSNDEDVYPQVNKQANIIRFWIKLISFIAITAIVVLVSINYMFPTNVWWSLFASAGIICAWASILTGIIKRKNIFSNITFELLLITVFAILWDVFTGWHAWSVEYVIPSCAIVSMSSMYIISKIMKVKTGDYIIYLIFYVFYGIVPIIFILTKMLRVVYPSVICVAISIVSITALLLFEGRNIKDEVNKKFHI